MGVCCGQAALTADALAKELVGMLTGAASHLQQGRKRRVLSLTTAFRLISISPLGEWLSPGLKAKGMEKGRKSKRSSDNTPNYEFVHPDPLMTQRSEFLARGTANSATLQFFCSLGQSRDITEICSFPKCLLFKWPYNMVGVDPLYHFF